MAEAEENEAREVALKRLKAQRSFKGLLATAIGVMALMTVIWLLGDRGYFWPIWVAFGLGIALVTTGWQAYGTRQGPITEAEIDREVDKLK